MKYLLNLEGIKALSKMEQKSVFRWLEPFKCTDKCQENSECPDGMAELKGVCKNTSYLGMPGWKYCDIE